MIYVKPSFSNFITVIPKFSNILKLQIPICHDQFFDFRTMTKKELERFPGNKLGWAFTSIMAEMDYYLPYLMDRYKARSHNLYLSFTLMLLCLGNGFYLCRPPYHNYVSELGKGVADFIKEASRI